MGMGSDEWNRSGSRTYLYSVASWRAGDVSINACRRLKQANRAEEQGCLERRMDIGSHAMPCHEASWH